MRFLPFLIAFTLAPVLARAEAPRVVTDIPPVGSLVARVMEGVGAPHVLVTSGASAHHFNLRPSDVKKLSQADLIVWVDEGLTPWLEEAMETVAPSTDAIALNEVDGITLWEFRENALFAGHADDDDHDHKAHSHDDGHEAHDPHTWLDPVNAALWVPVIADRLAQIDPGNAAAYRANAEATLRALEALILEIEGKFAAPSGAFFVYHDAFQYFERRFGVVAAGSISAGDAARPGAARIEALRDVARGGNIVCVFSEPQYSVDLIAPIFEGQSVKHAVLDPLGASLPVDGDHYGILLRTIADQIADCTG